MTIIFDAVRTGHFDGFSPKYSFSQAYVNEILIAWACRAIYKVLSPTKNPDQSSLFSLNFRIIVVWWASGLLYGYIELDILLTLKKE